MYPESTLLNRFIFIKMKEKNWDLFSERKQRLKKHILFNVKSFHCPFFIDCHMPQEPALEGKNHWTWEHFNLGATKWQKHNHIPRRHSWLSFYCMQILNYLMFFMPLIFAYCKYFNRVHATLEKVGLRAVVCVSSFTNLSLLFLGKSNRSNCNHLSLTYTIISSC